MQILFAKTKNALYLRHNFSPSSKASLWALVMRAAKRGALKLYISYIMARSSPPTHQLRRTV